MANYGVTKNGFVLKRMDTILEEIHSDLTKGYGFDTRLNKTSFLNVLVTTFANQIANLWEVGQESYYAKYPATATGVNLDNACQYGGIRRKEKKQTIYPLYCTGVDGTIVLEGHSVATSTAPQVKLSSVNSYTITREKANAIEIKVAAISANVSYSVTINGDKYEYVSTTASEASILNGLKTAIKNADYSMEVEGKVLRITDTNVRRDNVFTLSSNLTTSSVTVIAQYATEEYGRITIPNGLVDTIVTNVNGLQKVTNELDPTYGRETQTDVELRHDYMNKSAVRSNRMLTSIISEIKSTVDGVETAIGYENDEDTTDARGLPPHSINIIVEGGDEGKIASAILSKKAGGIKSYGKITQNVVGLYGDTIPVAFDRPEYLYTWLKVVLHGKKTTLPNNYKTLTIDALINDWSDIEVGNSLLVQRLDNSIYDNVNGISYVDITNAHSTSKSFSPSDGDYKSGNVTAVYNQKVKIDKTRIEVSFVEDT